MVSIQQFVKKLQELSLKCSKFSPQFDIKFLKSIGRIVLNNPHHERSSFFKLVALKNTNFNKLKCLNELNLY